MGGGPYPGLIGSLRRKGRETETQEEENKHTGTACSDGSKAKSASNHQDLEEAAKGFLPRAFKDDAGILFSDSQLPKVEVKRYLQLQTTLHIALCYTFLGT